MILTIKTVGFQNLLEQCRIRFTACSHRDRPTTTAFLQRCPWLVSRRPAGHLACGTGPVCGSARLLGSPRRGFPEPERGGVAVGFIRLAIAHRPTDHVERFNCEPLLSGLNWFCERIGHRLELIFADKAD